MKFRKGDRVVYKKTPKGCINVECKPSCVLKRCKYGIVTDVISNGNLYITWVEPPDEEDRCCGCSGFKKDDVRLLSFKEEVTK